VETREGLGAANAARSHETLAKQFAINTHATQKTTVNDSDALPIAVKHDGTLFYTATNGGTLSGNDGQVVGGLTIVLTGINDAGQVVTLTTTTAADGSYIFTGLLPGTYSVSAPSAKKDPGISGITLGAGETLSDEFFSLLGPDSKHIGGEGGA
jgi:hypothetical protein